jgi:DNA-binding MarR family transcriptional regulator
VPRRTAATAAADARPRLSRATEAGEPSLLYVMKQVELAVRAELDELVRPAGLTALQYTALTVLERHPNLTSAQLARNSFVTAQAMADMVGALQERGLIERHRDEQDRRRLVLALTGPGRKLLVEYRDRVAALEDRMLAGLTDAQVAQLRRSLLSCRAALSGHLPH